MEEGSNPFSTSFSCPYCVSGAVYIYIFLNLSSALRKSAYRRAGQEKRAWAGRSGLSASSATSDLQDQTDSLSSGILGFGSLSNSVGSNSHLTLFEKFWKSLESPSQILEPTESKIENAFNY